MPAAINELTQYLDSAGAPLVSGKIYIGTQNADPVLNPITIYSDRALTVAISNPQTLDANGRSTNKIWVPGRYSLRVDNVNDVQQIQELDSGEDVASGITSLTNVSGSDTITATAVATITAYTDRELYTFRTASANTGAVTLNIDGVGAKSIVKNQDQAILPAEFEADQNVIVSYNSTDDNFAWVNHNNKIVAFYEGSAVVAAATTDVWQQAGNTVHVTGNTGITSFGTARAAGDVRWVILDGTPLLTQGANLNLPGGVNFQAAAGDFLRLYADTTTQFDIGIFKADGTAVIGVRSFVSTQTGAVSTGTTDFPDDDTIPQNDEGDEYMTLAITPKNTNNRLIIEVVFNFAMSANENGGVALFQDTTADALAAVQQVNVSNNNAYQMILTHIMTAGTTSSTTFKVRAGTASTSTMTFNGSSGARKMGGVMASSIKITEVEP